MYHYKALSKPEGNSNYAGNLAESLSLFHYLPLNFSPQITGRDLLFTL